MVETARDEFARSEEAIYPVESSDGALSMAKEERPHADAIEVVKRMDGGGTNVAGWLVLFHYDE